MKNKYMAAFFLGVPAVFMILSFLIPVGFMIFLSFQPETLSGTYQGLSLEQYKRFFADTFYLTEVVWLSIKMGILSGIFSVILGYPVALAISRIGNPKIKTGLLILSIIPLWVNTVVRTLAWQIILADNGIINTFLNLVGLEKFKFASTEIGVLIGLVQISIPYVVLPLVGVLDSMSPSLEEAAYSVGASPFRAFYSITLPLSVPGVMSGALIVFALNAGAYAIPQMLGGGKVRMLSVVAYEQAMSIGNFPFASLLGLVLLICSILFIVPAQLLSNRVSYGKRKGANL